MGLRNGGCVWNKLCIHRNKAREWVTYLRYPPLQQVGGELVVVAQVAEAHDVVLGLGVLHQSNGGQHLDLQTL